MCIPQNMIGSYLLIYIYISLSLSLLFFIGLVSMGKIEIGRPPIFWKETTSKPVKMFQFSYMDEFESRVYIPATNLNEKNIRNNFCGYSGSCHGIPHFQSPNIRFPLPHLPARRLWYLDASRIMEDEAPALSNLMGPGLGWWKWEELLNFRQCHIQSGC